MNSKRIKVLSILILFIALIFGNVFNLKSQSIKEKEKGLKDVFEG
jgi:hypothetical protein